MQKKNLQNNKGFTIIETMIAVSLFLVVVMYGMNSLLKTTTLNRKSQDMRSIMDGLSFSMEEMSRNLRTGYDYHCALNAGDFGTITPQNCPAGGVGISFKTTSGTQWMYKITSPNTDENYSISKSTDNGATWIALTSSEISLNQYSGFFVNGATTGDNVQPMVNIRLVGKITSKNNITSPFSLETAVSQRMADITP